MEKIVEEFENEKRKEIKEEEGRIKIKEVVNWNVSEGKLYGKELSDLFKWEKSINN
jgi:hypothetical protein